MLKSEIASPIVSFLTGGYDTYFFSCFTSKEYCMTIKDQKLSKFNFLSY